MAKRIGDLVGAIQKISENLIASGMLREAAVENAIKNVSMLTKVDEQEVRRMYNESVSERENMIPVAVGTVLAATGTQITKRMRAAVTFLNSSKTVLDRALKTIDEVASCQNGFHGKKASVVTKITKNNVVVDTAKEGPEITDDLVKQIVGSRQVVSDLANKIGEALKQISESAWQGNKILITDPTYDPKQEEADAKSAEAAAQ